MGRIATIEFALAKRWGTDAHRTCSGMSTKPPPTPSSPPSRPPRKPIAAKTARRLYRGPHELTANGSEFVGILYSVVVRIGASGWLITTEWWRNSTFAWRSPPGCFAFFGFFFSRPCLSRPLPMVRSFHDQGQFAQEGLDIGDQPDRLPAPAVGQLGHHRGVDVDADRTHPGGQHVAGRDRVQHR